MNGTFVSAQGGVWLAAPLAILAAISLTAADTPQAAPSDGPFKPTDASLRHYQCPDWFRDAKLGIWAVWGPESVPMQGDWYA
jgi:alpha-L-fucosidase